MAAAVLPVRTPTSGMPDAAKREIKRLERQGRRQ